MEKQLLLTLEKKVKKIKVEGFLISKEHQKVFEYLKNNKIYNKTSKVYSITKTIVSLLIGIAIDRKYIESIHTPIYTFFPDLKDKKRDISLFHLLTMTSGLKVTNFQGSNNWVSTILAQPLVFEPGTTFQYNSGDSHVLSAILSKITGKSTEAFADEYLFGPLKIQKYLWVKDPQGINGGGFSVSLNMDDMLKVGTLLLDNGRYGKNQIVSTKWVNQMQSTYKELETTEKGTYGYGYQVWTFKSNHDHNPIHFYYANGIYGQYIVVLPQLKVVAVIKSQLHSDTQALPMEYFQELITYMENDI
ncbi:serine hydrolase domain-containing protein [Fredinandcohnia sp. 179-A 10B2 NHS]|uniref:serine hydrolase domain-containing protein n=1 Tax=Fredinandcohnia sp. 179-A 10B2 NHS TaxID=3235176 RepID=UPI00399F74DE